MNSTSPSYETDPRSSEELVAACRAAWARQEYDCNAFAPLHFRGGELEFQLGKKLTECADAPDREIGARILGQLGGEKQSFLEESMPFLLSLLLDPEPDVVAQAVWALGHLRDDRAVDPMIALAGHPSAGVRYAVASSLPGASLDSPLEPRAAAALVPLCADGDFNTRNWAMFGLGQMHEQDTPAIRDALVQGSCDDDPEIRGEALVGLAMRKLPGAVYRISRDLDGEILYVLTLETARELADPALLPALHRWRSEQYLPDATALQVELDQTIHLLEALQESPATD
jgi:hypothetical protein